MTNTFRVRIEGVPRVRARLRNFIKYAQHDCVATTAQYSETLLRAVQRNASGRPGPNVITGTYRASWRRFVDSQYVAGAESDAPQARRLEYGFVGIDALGRHYRQPPFPHVEPAKLEVGPMYFAAMKNNVRKWWK